MYYHKTALGDKIRLCDMDLRHLENYINYILRKSREGLTIRRGGGNSPDDFWYDEETLFGDDVLIKLNYKEYIKELEKRKNENNH